MWGSENYKSVTAVTLLRSGLAVQTGANQAGEFFEIVKGFLAHAFNHNAVGNLIQSPVLTPAIQFVQRLHETAHGTGSLAGRLRKDGGDGAALSFNRDGRKIDLGDLFRSELILNAQPDHAFPLVAWGG